MGEESRVEVQGLNARIGNAAQDPIEEPKDCLGAPLEPDGDAGEKPWRGSAAGDVPGAAPKGLSRGGTRGRGRGEEIESSFHGFALETRVLAPGRKKSAKIVIFIYTS